MDPTRLDRLARALAAAPTRRGAIALLLAALAPAAPAGARPCGRGEAPCGGACCTDREQACRDGRCDCLRGFVPCGAECCHRWSEVCRGGRCACKPGHRRCDREPPTGSRRPLCTPLAVSTRHCGRCGNRCRRGEECVGGECVLRAGDRCDPADDRCEAGSSCTGSWPDFQWEPGVHEDRTPICCLRSERWGLWCAPDSACCGGKCEPHPTWPCP